MPATPSRNANIALWVVQVLVAAVFLMAGSTKFMMPVDQMTKGTVFTGGFMHFIGACELLGALGLLLPGITRRHRGLTPVAALGLMIIVIGATVVTLTGPMPPATAVLPAVVAVLCAVIAWGRRGDLAGASAAPAPVIAP